MLSAGSSGRGYYCCLTSREGSGAVQDFVVGRKGFGSVCFLGTTLISELPKPLDEFVLFSKVGEIVVYPKGTTKPPRGSGLNKPAIITLHNCWPGGGNAIDVEEALRGVKDTTFLNYCHHTGTWTFRVEHFTRYGLPSLDDDDGEDDDEDLEDGADAGDEDVDGEGEGEGEGEGYEDEADGDEGDDEEELELKRRSDLHDEDEDMESDEMGHMSEDDRYDEDLSEDEYPVASSIPFQPKLPQQLGLEPRKFQLMKSSLFSGAEETAQPSVASKLFTPPVERTGLPFQFPFKRQAIVSSPVKPPTPTAPVSISLSMAKRTTLRPVPPKDALSHKRTHLGVDAGLFLGRSFSVGFAPDLVFMHPGFPVIRFVKESAQFGLVQIERPFVSSIKTDQYEAYLFKHLEHSEPKESPFAGGAPWWRLKQVDANIKANMELSRAHKESAMPSDPLLIHTYQIWSLIDALWGIPPGGTPVWEIDEGARAEGVEHDTYVEDVMRRTLLSNWLKGTLSESVDGDSSETYLQRIFSLLTGMQIAEAMKLAITNKNFRLATLISQACNPSMRQDLQAQLAQWEEDGMLDPKLFKPELLRIYRLLSGDTFGVSQSLDWKRALALTFWYGSENEIKQETIAEVMARYSNLVEDSSQYPTVRVPQPLPPYLETKVLGKKRGKDFGSLWKFGNDTTTQTNRNNKDRQQQIEEDLDSDEKDTLYHLLRLYCDRGYGVSKLIGGGGHTPAALDCHLSWLLCTLFINMANGKYATPSSLNNLYHSYAAQLEAVGLWRWAVYVILNLPFDETADDDPRAPAVKDILSRHIDLENTREAIERDKFLIERLHVPKLWISEAKAWRAGYEHKEEVMLYHLTAEQTPSSNWLIAHRLLLQSIAPEYMLQGRYAELQDILEKMMQQQTSIPGWDSGGGIYYSFLTLHNEVPPCLARLSSHSGDFETQHRLRELQERAEQLAKQFSALNASSPNATPTQRRKLKVCITEMSDKIVDMLLRIKQQLAHLPPVDDQPLPEVVDMAPSVLPMDIPDGKRLNLLRSMCDAYLISLQS